MSLPLQIDKSDDDARTAYDRRLLIRRSSPELDPSGVVNISVEIWQRKGGDQQHAAGLNLTRAEASEALTAIAEALGEDADDH